MANIRKIQLTDNISQAAQDLIDFILKVTPTVEAREAHRQVLLNIVNQVKNKYEQTKWQMPFLSMLEYMIHTYSRQRGAEIESANNQLHHALADDKIVFLHVITGLMARGGCDSTSANTILLALLIAQLPKYNDLDADERLNKLGWNASAAKMGMREALRDVFVNKAKATIEIYQLVAEKQASIYATEKPKVGKLKLADGFADKLGGAVCRGKDGMLLTKPIIYACIIEDYPISRTITTKYADVIASLEKTHVEHLVTQKPEGQKSASQSFAANRAKLGLFFQAKHGLNPIASDEAPSFESSSVVPCAGTGSINPTSNTA